MTYSLLDLVDAAILENDPNACLYWSFPIFDMTVTLTGYELRPSLTGGADDHDGSALGWEDEPQPVLEAPSATVSSFLTLLEILGFAYDITPFWVGRLRYGSLNLYAQGPLGPVLFDSFTYARTSTRWTAADAKLGRLNRGGSKHRAVLTAFRSLDSFHHAGGSISGSAAPCQVEA